MKRFSATNLLFGLSLLRSNIYTIEGLWLPWVEFYASGRLPPLPIQNLPLLIRARRSLYDLLRRDAERAAKGIYPTQLLLSADSWKSLLEHVQRLPRLVNEAMGVSRRRKQNETKSFGAKAAQRARTVPEYYRRNFHFQKDGYLSEDSAELYDHQVELLFAGAADPMRRLAIEPLKKCLAGKKRLKILEIGCGTGSATRFLEAAFPNASITAVDLSEPYLASAQRKVPRVKFLRGDGEKLRFKDQAFDAVVSVFLFHELPIEVRKSVLRESRRVLKKNGTLVFVDSTQLGDDPKLDEPLRMFPVEFHEPFYPNYIRNPMEALLASEGFCIIGKEIGFFAKACAAKPVASL